MINSIGAAIRYHDIPSFDLAEPSNPNPEIPLVFIHGRGCASSCDYPRIIMDPALKKRRFILIDLLGSGFSDKPIDFGYTPIDHAKSIIDLLDSLNLKKINLYGHSLGGTIAIVIAYLQPNRINNLILSEPTLERIPDEYIPLAASKPESDYIASGFSDELKSARESENYIWAGSMAISSPIAIYREIMGQLVVDKPTWLEQLLSLSIPRTVIFGENSLPHPYVAKLENTDVSLDFVAKAGHSMMWENPSGLAKAIQNALEK